MKDVSRLQQKINKKIKSLRFRSIRKILWKMLKVYFPDRGDIEKLLIRIKLRIVILAIGVNLGKFLCICCLNK